FGVATGEVLAMLAADDAGALVLLDEPHDPDALLARIRQQDPAARPGKSGTVGEWRRNGAGAQILHDLGFGRLRVLGTPRRQVGPVRGVRPVAAQCPPAAAAPARARIPFPILDPSPGMNHYEGDLSAPDGARFAIIASRWNPRITDSLVAGARKAFADHGVDEAAIDVVRVPGAWEIPMAARQLAAGAAHRAIVALGCVVRGEIGRAH